MGLGYKDSLLEKNRTDWWNRFHCIEYCTVLRCAVLCCVVALCCVLTYCVVLLFCFVVVLS